MTPETRATKIAAELAGRLMAHGWVEDVHHPMFLHVDALIANALREAGNAAYERAAALLDEGPLNPEQFALGKATPADFNDIADRIRSLKTQEN